MKILETVFFSLMIALPSLILLLGLARRKRVVKNARFRNTLIKLFLLTLIINGVAWGVLKMHNDKKEEETKQNETYKNPNELDEENNKKPEDPNKEGDSNDNKGKSTTSQENPNETEPPKTTGSSSSSGVTSKGYKIEVIDGVTYIDGYMIANKTYALPSTYVPTNTTKPVTATNCADCLDKEALDAYTRMKNDAASDGHTIWIASGYRSYSYQNALYNGYVNRAGKAEADTYSARPGHSEHQTGLAFDLNTVSESFGSTKEGIWVNENCYKYGFILRYPKGKDGETGYIYEPWHFRYVGTDLASKLYNSGDWITMETYFGITSEYSN